MSKGRAIKFWRALFLLALLIAIPSYFFLGRTPEIKYQTAPVTRGPIVRAVAATGTVNPVTTVQVGTYVSGPILQIYADYNSPVKAGQLIAKIDPRTFKFQVLQAQATLANSQAQLSKDRADLAYKKLSYLRDRDLLRSGAISQDTLDNAASAYHMVEAQMGLDEAAIRQQQASLAQAQVNLNYTDIVSPVDGTVVSRNVDVGQTVAASFQTPTLFLIAKDLTRMQVDSNVSESDIGHVHEGQSASFRVDAFPDRDFQGAVGQVRQAPITVQNVVTYDVVVNVSNPELLLKPGMTANVTIATERRDDVLRVPLQAVRFSPDGQAHKFFAGAAADFSYARRGKKVWVLDRGELKPVRVTTGLDDGTYVEVISGDLHPGEQVVTSEIVAPVKKASAPRAPHF